MTGRQYTARYAGAAVLLAALLWALAGAFHAPAAMVALAALTGAAALARGMLRDRPRPPR